jgi:hypothetical protein
MDGHTERRGSRSPEAGSLGYPDSTLEVADRGDRVEFLWSRARDAEGNAWLSVDREHFVVDLRAHR